MKQIFTLFVSGMLCLFTKSAFAQFPENFNNGAAPLNSSCWILTDIMHASSTNNPGYLIEGGGSLYTEPPVSSADIRTIKTPFLNVTANSITISFLYKVTNKISSNASRWIQVGLENSVGDFISLGQLNLDRNSPWNSNETFSITSAVTPGAYKVVLRIGGSGGDGNSRIVLDALDINASYQYAGGCPPENTTLPVALISFSGNIADQKTTLTWKVADNEEARHFEIERSYDGKNFSSAGIVLSSSKSGEETYSFFEKVTASKVSYRLKMIDKDGKAEYSRILSLGTQNMQQANKNLSLMNNPISSNIVLSYHSYKSSPVSIQVYNEAGALLYHRKQQSNTGVNQFVIDGAQLKKGVYLVQVTNEAFEKSIVKAVKL